MLSSVLNLLVHIGMWRFLLEGCAYVSAQHNPWSTRITIEYNKTIDLILRHKLQMTVRTAAHFDTNNTYRLLSRSFLLNVFIEI